MTVIIWPKIVIDTVTKVLYISSISRRNDAAQNIEALEPHRRRHRNNIIDTITPLRYCQAASSSRISTRTVATKHSGGPCSYGFIVKTTPTIAAPSLCPDSFRVIHHHR
jgi:hypothetical protein